MPHVAEDGQYPVRDGNRDDAADDRARGGRAHSVRPRRTLFERKFIAMKKLIALTLILCMLLAGSAFAEELLIGTQETGTAG